VIRFLIATSALLAAAPLQAQVGVPPEKSPFRDIEYRMEVTFESGPFISGGDPVGVAPKSGTYFGGRYDYSIGSLIGVAGRLGLVPTKRNLLDPTAPEGSRITGEGSSSLIFFDGSLTLGLTGGRSFHHLAPYLQVGMGMVTDLELADSHGYDLGPRFMFVLGGGVRWLVRPEWQIRLDATSYIFNVTYPPSYFDFEPGETPVRTGDQKSSTHNLALTLGLSYRFFR
jgi:hypothetical protein